MHAGVAFCPLVDYHRFAYCTSTDCHGHGHEPASLQGYAAEGLPLTGILFFCQKEWPLDKHRAYCNSFGQRHCASCIEPQPDCHGGNREPDGG